MGVKEGVSRQGSSMGTKRCVLGAVLGAASVLPVVCLPLATPTKQSKEEQQGGVSRQAGRPFENHQGEPSSPAAVPASPAMDEPKHPCELVTVMRVPCDPATSTCEYTYWECPLSVKPLRA
jgi:hypothetical protein